MKKIEFNLFYSLIDNLRREDGLLLTHTVPHNSLDVRKDVYRRPIDKLVRYNDLTIRVWYYDREMVLLSMFVCETDFEDGNVVIEKEEIN